METKKEFNFQSNKDTAYRAESFISANGVTQPKGTLKKKMIKDIRDQNKVKTMRSSDILNILPLNKIKTTSFSYSKQKVFFFFIRTKQKVPT